jgi:hypothetical protein
MSKRGQREPDPFHEIREWQDHRYDPGYFLGGRVHPILKGSRPNPYGFVLIVSGLVSVFFFGGAVRSGGTWLLLSTGLSGFVAIAAGFALLQRGKKRDDKH